MSKTRKIIYTLITMLFANIYIPIVYAQTIIPSSCSGTYGSPAVCTIAGSGSFKLGGNITTYYPTSHPYTILITGSNVTLDLGGYTVSGGATCNISNTAIATHCNPATSDNSSLIYVYGQNVTIKNGYVVGSYGNGIIGAPNLYSGVNQNQNLIIQDVTVSNNVGTGIITYKGSMLFNVTAYENGGNGIVTDDDGMYDHVNSSYNNGYGIQTGTVVMNNIITKANGIDGINHNGGIAGGVLSNVNSWANGGNGLISTGLVVTSGDFSNNTRLGLNASGSLLTNVTAGGNNGSTTGAQYLFDAYSCYINLLPDGGTITGTGRNGSASTGCQ